MGIVNVYRPSQGLYSGGGAFDFFGATSKVYKRSSHLTAGFENSSDGIFVNKPCTIAIYQHYWLQTTTICMKKLTWNPNSNTVDNIVSCDDKPTLSCDFSNLPVVIRMTDIGGENELNFIHIITGYNNSGGDKHDYLLQAKLCIVPDDGDISTLYAWYSGTKSTLGDNLTTQYNLPGKIHDGGSGSTLNITSCEMLKDILDHK